MRMREFGRWGSRAAPLFAAGSSLGASCFPPGALNTITIANGGRLFVKVAPSFITNGWDACTLGDVAQLDQDLDPSRSTLTLYGSFPRELMVFNLPMFEDSTPGSGASWLAPLNIQFASLPARNTGPETPTSVEMKVPWAVFMARLIDHGACRSVIPWITPSPQYRDGFFSWLNGRIFANMSERLVARSSFLHPKQDQGIYQASFLRPRCDFNSLANNDDGFALNNKYHVDYGSFLGGITAAEVGVQANYALFAKNGWIGVKLAGSFGLDFSAKDIRGFDSAAARSEIANNITNTAAFERQSLDDVARREVEAVGAFIPGLTNFNFGKCSLDSSGFPNDSQCRKPEVRDALFAALSIKLGQGLKGPALKSAIARARTLADTTRDQTFFCSAGPNPDQPGCFWHPFLKRIHVTPSAVEAVWYDVNEPESPDVDIVRILSPADAPVCTTHALPTPAQKIPTKSTN